LRFKTVAYKFMRMKYLSRCQGSDAKDATI
jgi:hypothetical protein